MRSPYALTKRSTRNEYVYDGGTYRVRIGQCGCAGKRNRWQAHIVKHGKPVRIKRARINERTAEEAKEAAEAWIEEDREAEQDGDNQ